MARTRDAQASENSPLWTGTGGGKNYRFPTTPVEVRIDQAQIRIMDSAHHHDQFRAFADQLVRRIRRRVPEATLVRALRRFAVKYAKELCDATDHTTFRGRAITEDDMIEVLENTFGLRSERRERTLA